MPEAKYELVSLFKSFFPPISVKPSPVKKPKLSDGVVLMLETFFFVNCKLSWRVYVWQAWSDICR
jgi:hypothetical protein